MRSRLTLLVVQLLCCNDLARANCLNDFTAKEVPQLKDIPDISEQIQNLSPRFSTVFAKASSGARMLEDGNSTIVPVVLPSPPMGRSFVMVRDCLFLCAIDNCPDHIGPLPYTSPPVVSLPSKWTNGARTPTR